MKIAYIHLEDDIIVTSIRTKKFPPKNVVAICPKDIKGNWITDIDVLDVVGGVATFNQTKFDAKQQLIVDRETAAQTTRDAKTLELNQINAIDIDSIIDSDDKTTLKRVLKYLIKKASR